jgi:hypothetical protein
MSQDLTKDELDSRIADVRENLRTLVELAAGTIGAADEDRINDRIEEQQARLDLLVQQRDALDKAG